MPYRFAARTLLQRTGTVFLLTGFYIPGAGTIETDGICGTWSLFKALTALGNDVFILCDDTSEPILKHLFPSDNRIPFPVEPQEASAARAQKILDTFTPHAVIAVERPGPAADNRYYNCRGEDITGHVARMETLFGTVPDHRYRRRRK